MEKEINIFGKVAMLDRVYYMRQGDPAAVFFPSLFQRKKKCVDEGNNRSSLSLVAAILCKTVLMVGDAVTKLGPMIAMKKTGS